MENFILHILKINLLAAVCIIFVALLSRFVKSKYSSFWRYLIWLIIAVFLLIPVNPVKENHVVTLEVSQNEYQFNTRYPGENTTAAPARTSPENYDKSKTIIKPGESAISKNNAHKPLLTPSEALNFFFILWIAGGIFFLFFKISAYLFSLSNLKRWGIPEKIQKSAIYMILYVLNII